MTLTVVLIILLVGGLCLLGIVLYKKWPQLKIVDPTSDPELQSKQLKRDIMRQRALRVGDKHVKTIQSSVLSPMQKGLQNAVRRVAGKLTAVERRYQEKQKHEGGTALDKETVKRLIEEGKKLTSEEMWDSAERKFIEVISSDPKNVDAYEELGWLYFSKKDYDLARETFTFLLKLSPKDASVTAALGELEERLGNHEGALVRFKKAVKLSPKNPKYLDFLITCAIHVGDRHLADTTLDRLRQVNPDNAKIVDFEEQIAELPTIVTHEPG